MGTPIPVVPGLPFLGNLRDIDPENPLVSAMHLADLYGPIYKLSSLGQERIVVSNYELLNELCDEKRFSKQPSGALMQVRNGTGDGLFTAFGAEENWGLAHRILMPAFGPMAIRDMFDEMLDIGSQLVSKWARYGPDNRIHVTEDFTRLTLDSIALCALDTRFNSFYREDLHPFVEAMQFFLLESGARFARPALFSQYLYGQSTKKYWESIEIMKSVSDGVIKERRAHPTEKKDLVNAMIKGEDPKTGKHLSDKNIINNMITFLIAGHETTSGLLSFLFVLFLQNPRAYKTAQSEVDEVIGKGPVSYEHMSKLPYITACLRECLRLYPTAPGFTVAPLSQDPKDYPVYLGKERYEIEYGRPIGVILPRIQRDPAVWGEDAEEFKPERMLDEKFTKLPPNAWKPFGNGLRGCIGRPFAWQEAHLIVALLLQNFNFRAQDSSYKLSWKQTLTIKPKDFLMYATMREGIDPIHLERNMWNGGAVVRSSTKENKIERMKVEKGPQKPMTILYGSNTGTCESLAQTMANSASVHGYKPIVKTLDSASDKIPKGQPVIIVTASYEGQPTDNAAYFMEWLQGVGGSQLEGTQYAVFGCGHRDWQATFQKIPKLTDELLAKHGGKRLTTRGYADAADNDIFNDFDKWMDQTLWPGIAAEFGVKEESANEDLGLDIEITTNTRSSDLRQDVSEAIVKHTMVLTTLGEPEKRHIEIQLPTGVTYRAGDYLAVLPINDSKTVKRVMNRFGLPWDAKIHIKIGQNTVLPTGRDMSVYDLLASYVELNQPATTKHITAIVSSVPDKSVRDSLTDKLLNPSRPFPKRLSPLDLLEATPSAALSFQTYLSFLPPMRIRQYSISSSPLHSPNTCALTYAVIDIPAPSLDTISGSPSPSPSLHRTIGVATTFLASLLPGDKLLVAVRPSHTAFHPPLDIANIPVLMLCAGSGLAPFRGFVQERACQLRAGRTLAPAVLFIGCRHPDRDTLYRAELAEWQKEGAVEVRYAFSQCCEHSEGCKYVQDRLWREKEEVTGLWEQGARVYVCGSAGLGEGVGEAMKRIYGDECERRGKNKTKEEIEGWFAGIRNERFASDVFT